MTYYIFLENGKLNGCGECPQLTEGVENLEVSEDVYNAYGAEPERFVYSDCEIVKNPEYESLLEQKQKTERIQEIKQQLYDLDIKTIRALRAGETDYINQYETQAEELRVELQNLGGSDEY